MYVIRKYIAEPLGFAAFLKMIWFQNLGCFLVNARSAGPFLMLKRDTKINKEEKGLAKIDFIESFITFRFQSTIERGR